MRNWIVSFLLCCLIVSGCGVPKNDGNRPGNRSESLQALPEAAPLADQADSEVLPVLPAPALVTPPSPPAIQEREPPKLKLNAGPIQAPNAPQEPPKKTKRAPKPSVPVQQNRVVHNHLSLAELRLKYSDSFKVRGSTNEKKAALTFDDGPDLQFTPQILDVLKKNRVKATFFVVGFLAEAHPDLIERMVKEGHVIGNHSYSHALFTKLSGPKFESQIESTQSVVRRLAGYAPKLLRPPYGAINEEQIKWASAHHFLIVNWNVDSLDWKGLSAEQVSRNILSHTHPGSIILQHSGGGDGQDLSGTVKALPEIIQKLKVQGYELVTVPELLHVPKNK
jgi:polysaccharide deacetylase family sporulation protein PdaB